MRMFSSFSVVIFVLIVVILFSEDALGELSDGALKNEIKDVDDYEELTKGADKILGSFKRLDEFGSSICTSSCEEFTLNIIKKIGRVSAKYGDEVADITTKGIKKGVINPLSVDPEKLAQYIKGFGKDPTNVALGEGQLLKIYKSPSRVTKVGGESVNDVLILRKGNGLESGSTAWGFDHAQKHVDDFKRAFGVDDPESINAIIQDVLENGHKGISTDPGFKEVIEKTVTYNGKEALVRIPYVVKNTDYGAMTGDIASYFPVI